MKERVKCEEKKNVRKHFGDNTACQNIICHLIFAFNYANILSKTLGFGFFEITLSPLGNIFPI
jgi:hypothetical protein